MSQFVSWKETREKAAAVREAADTQSTPEDKQAVRDHLRAQVRAYRLAEIRRAQNLTQTEVAKAMGTGQSNVSRTERGDLDAAELPTLRCYIEALGGRLRVIADFGDHQVDAC